MREDAASGKGRARTAALVLVLTALTAWVGATSGATAPPPGGPGAAPMPATASLSLGAPASGTVDFVPMPGSTPTPRGAARLPPRGGPFTLVADLPATGSYVLSVQVAADIVDAVTGAPIPATDVSYATHPVGPTGPPGCQSSGWRSIGGGARVAVLHGPGVCRLRVRLRWSWGAGAAPGHYRGALRWVLSSAAP